VSGASVYAGGPIFTGQRSRPWVEALVVRGPVVVAAGRLQQVRDAVPDATELDLAGRMVAPGFIDAHNHFLSTGESMASLDLRYPAVDSPEALLDVIRTAATAAAPSDVINGFGFDHGKYELPTLTQLDDASNGHPLLVFHTSGHHVLVNSRVLRDAGIDDTIQDPPGGAFVRDADAHVTGLCLDTACGLVVPTDVDIGSHGPNFHVRAPMDTLVAAVERAGNAYLEAGLTCVADAQVTSRELAAYREARRRELLPVRTVCMPLSHQLEAFTELGLAGPFGDDLLSIGHLKVYADGTLTGRTAAFSDELGVADQSASFFHEPAALVSLIEGAWTAGWDVAVHAQGDRAIGLALDGFERGTRAAPRDGGRPRIEHAGYPGEYGIERMRSLGVIAVQQPSYLFDYGDEYLTSLGDVAHDLQPWRAEIDAGVRVVISSDSDVSSYRPLTTIANAMRRESRSGVVIGARHRLSLEEALFAHTIDAAYAIGSDDRLGSLEPGKAADLTILPVDLRRLEPSEIEALGVSATILAGEVRYEAP
jgi:predicted amidohydrolase YtcJ